jgi:hypothetical protein
LRWRLSTSGFHHCLLWYLKNEAHDQISNQEGAGAGREQRFLTEFRTSSFLNAEEIMIQQTPILVSTEQVMAMLTLTEEQVTWLSNTGQLQPINICGQVRFDAHDVRSLVDNYRSVQRRRKSS